jgi:predicted nicotinamide N-methyase
VTNERIVPVMSASRGLAVVEAALALTPAHTLRIRRPKEPGVLLDLEEVHEHYTKDEYMPYWATLWPVSLHLARFLLLRGAQGAKTALELGCGLGIAGCAALRLGLDVTFTDYDESALEWTLANAALNAPPGASYRAKPLDFRAPLDQRFDLLLAADMIYEARNVGPLVAAFARMLAPGGTALVADQNRPYADEFKRELAAQGFVAAAHPVGPDPLIDPDAKGTIYVVTRIQGESS